MGPVHILPCVLRRNGWLAAPALAHRRQSLRTIFITSTDQPFQLVQPTRDLALTLLDR
jgi:hypothetical protein